MPAHDPALLRQAFGSFLTGVTVVTTQSKDGELLGFTANSFTSVSLDPPLLLVCPGKHLNSFGVYESATHFAVNILAEGQENISNTFASAKDNRFNGLSWNADVHGSPLIKGACASFSCVVHQRHDAGDHMILIGEVTDFKCTQQAGLGYCSSGYFSLGKERLAEASTSSNQTGITGALIERDDGVLLAHKSGITSIPSTEQASDAGARSTLERWFESLGLAVSVGPVYSIYNDAHGRQHTYFRAKADSANTAGIGQFEPVDNIADMTFEDAALTTMLNRFATEYRNQSFGLYIGDAESGEVHHQ